MTVVLTPEQAAARRTDLLGTIRHHRREAVRAKRALEQLEADCARHGIRLVREPIRAQGGRDPDAAAHSDDR